MCMLAANNKNKKKLYKFLDEYFNTFFNVKMLRKLLAKSRNEITWNWQILSDQSVKNKINPKLPIEVLKKYFVKVFPQSDLHKIINVFKF